MTWAPEYLDHGARVPTSDADDGLVPHPPFYFDSRRVRIDWRLLHSLDLGQIQIRTDLDALSRVLDLIAYGDLEAEDVRNLSETNFLKIFRLAQMIVEYLLYVQTSLNRESKYYQQMHHKEKSHIAALRLRCREQKEQLSASKRELRQCKSHLKTMQVLAEHGNRENQAPNPQPPPPPPPPQVVYVDSPDTLALVQQLQDDLDRMTEQRRSMQNTIDMLTKKLEEIEDEGFPVAAEDGDYAGNPLFSPMSMPGGRASDYATPRASPQRAGDGEQLPLGEVSRRVEAARREEREECAAELSALRQKVDGLEAEKSRLEDVAKEAASRSPPAKQPSLTGMAQVERLRRQLEEAEGKQRNAEEEQNRLRRDVEDLQDELERTQAELRVALAAKKSSTGLGDMEDDNSPPRWDRERSELKAALAEAQGQLSEAERKLAAVGEGGNEARQLRQQVERLKLANSDMVLEAQSLRDEVTKYKHLSESRTPARVSGDGAVSELESRVAELGREREQLLMDVEVARDAADKLRDELDDRNAEVKRLEALLDKAGIEFEADLKQAASEGRRVKHQAEHFMKTVGDSAGKPPSGPRSGSVTPPPQPKKALQREEEPRGASTSRTEMEEVDVEDFSDPNDSPMASLAGPVPTRMLAGSSSSFSSTRDLRSASEKGGAGGLLARSASVSRMSAGAVTPQRRAIGDVKRTSMGWSPDVGSSPITPKPSQAPPDPEESTDIEELKPEDLAPKPSQPFGGISSRAASERADSSVLEEEVESFRQSDDESDDVPPGPAASQPSAESKKSSLDVPTALPPIAPKPASAAKPPAGPPSSYSRPGSSIPSPARSAVSSSPPASVGDRAEAAPGDDDADSVADDLLTVPYGPYDDVDDMARSDPGIPAAEEREVVDQRVEARYMRTADSQRLWEERQDRFKDIFRYDTLIEGKQGRRSTTLLTMATLNDAKNKHGKAIRQELDKEIRSYGVDPLKTHMSDEEFAAVMEELDRRRDEVDRAVANNPEFQEHIRFMRDTIRYHLQSESEAFKDSGQARGQADPPANIDRTVTDDFSLDEDIETPRVDENQPSSDEDARTLGRYARRAAPSGGPAPPAISRDDDRSDSNDHEESPSGSQSALLLRVEEEEGPEDKRSSSPKSSHSASKSRTASTERGGAGSEVEELSSFDASSDEGDLPGAAAVVAGPSKPSGPVWSRSHDDPFETSTESTGGGAWGAQRATGRSSSMTSPAALVINSYDDDFDDDTLEELMA